MGFGAQFRSSLTYPIAATLVLVTVVPVIVVGLLLAAYNREHLTTVEKRYLQRQAVNLAGEVAGRKHRHFACSDQKDSFLLKVSENLPGQLNCCIGD